MVVSMWRATLTSKGQITIPAEVRRELGLRAGSRVNFVRTSAGDYELIPETRSIDSLKGVIRVRKGQSVSVEEMDAAIERQH